jgi:hypothetical protein
MTSKPSKSRSADPSRLDLDEGTVDGSSSVPLDG